MSGIWGRNIEISIFGESHGEGVGITIHNLPPGIHLDLDFIKSEMTRRAPGKNLLTTQRVEGDEFSIISGFFEGRTTGTPLCAFIRNNDRHPGDYDELKDKMRPGHGDYTGRIKYKGFNDYRGGGHFSGRLTAPLVFAGAVAKQILSKEGIIIGSHIYSIKDLKDDAFDPVNIAGDALINLAKMDFPVLSPHMGEKMKNAILDARSKLDSLGGIIECAAINLPSGIGSPFFHSMESTLSQLLFSIPAVKGVEFGAGFGIAAMTGSQANDEYYLHNGTVKTYTNNNGGILGGITNGMPLIFRTAIKPTPSIPKEQKTVDLGKMENTILKLKGRHDPCIVPRAVPVVEAAAALAILDLMYD